jgi:hypothetical protein
VRVRPLHALFLALVILFAGCSYGSLAGVRFTYVVKYSVTSTDPLSATTPTVTYTDDTGANSAPAAVALPWSVELPATGYDYSAPYYANLGATAAALTAGEAVTATISWKDYRTGFTEEVLVHQTVADSGAGTTPLDVILYAPELPLAR